MSGTRNLIVFNIMIIKLSILFYSIKQCTYLIHKKRHIKSQECKVDVETYYFIFIFSLCPSALVLRAAVSPAGSMTDSDSDWAEL